MSISIIGEEWAKKNAGIFSGEEGRSSSALSQSSLVFGAVTVMSMADLVVAAGDLYEAVKRRSEDERAVVGPRARGI